MNRLSDYAINEIVKALNIKVIIYDETTHFMRK